MRKSYHKFLKLFGAKHCPSPEAFERLKSLRLTPQQEKQFNRLRRETEQDPSPDNIRQFMDTMTDDPFHPLLLSLDFDFLELTGLKIRSILSSPAHILEVGRFTGYLSLWLVQEFPESEIQAIDFSEAAIKRARRFAEVFGVPNISFHHLDITKTTPEGTCDTVLAVGSLDHLQSQSTALEKTRNVISDKGQLIVVTRYQSLPSLQRLMSTIAGPGLTLQHFDWLYSVDLGHLIVHAFLIFDTQSTAPGIDLDRQHHAQLISQFLLATVGCSVHPDDHDWRIGQIWPGSNADQADIQPGDMLHSVNNIRLHDMTENKIRQIYMGTSMLRLELRRDGSAIQVKVNV